ncbi:MULTISPECIES: tRNA (N6-threonylcarbamoyladenosine(37)-N6)-methyltransferase TrmO [unclassified Colwellia]|uniref:tRNA (N6-threonylcarbamoyladenosine(37)-N6)-methyltransferase TrmO n=1 Tax=unclassified Colwellia TaxID=196834 RepID=UPI0015F47E74|nr:MULTISPECIES: tRNA (N6-threonylcarbamoyladenosine(37)-N6)-methyltransferase TrmO [unclassified Colwellia]MBA6233581.1 tRNA (N6-threonylcarbamoyladenosine(37)-N6)-methyltransferase TrmO [Colwellia sp. MB02u-7]MBA6238141.1 tRNA (N6-threonylcarbamoyladenosine(37)-N6)-methyltransferase TrmO [Colwellia sp. MB02u-11]MBA6255095.1 tRNA (N6-threonylcarbamoyladenosine(37)-N6)-methyltransferase TrmO [Colwellia sp. MB3u-28]MBA6258954.1 tRNA (N6-threonylcarbamoyladenosine(37)-N6)-methyltransferase TrmO [
MQEQPSSQITFNYIGRVNSPYKEKFAIPRQPGLVSAAKGSISLIDNANNEELVRGIEQFSHLWVLFIFHATAQQGWKPLVRPPRLGGNKKLGVLATRSTFRPNPIGMSVVKLENIEQKNKQLIINIAGLDFLDQTPVIDIKPYIPYSDSISGAQAGFAQQQPFQALSIKFSKQAQEEARKYQQVYADLSLFIEQVLAQDPRPAYKKQQEDTKIYGMILYDLNILWQAQSSLEITVLSISKIGS